MAQILTTLTQQQPNTHILLKLYAPSKAVRRGHYSLWSQKKNRVCVHPEVYGQNLREFLALLSQMNYLVGNEGGAVNMAKALNIPTFTLFFPLDQ